VLSGVQYPGERHYPGYCTTDNSVIRGTIPRGKTLSGVQYPAQHFEVFHRFFRWVRYPGQYFPLGIVPRITPLSAVQYPGQFFPLGIVLRLKNDTQRNRILFFQSPCSFQNFKNGKKNSKIPIFITKSII
jgi:hypothetical protein